MTKTNQMQPLYKKIERLGFKQKQIKALLPSWWDDAIADTPAGLQEATLTFARTFHVTYTSLCDSLDNDRLPEYSFNQHKFKHSRNLNKERLQPAVAVAMLAAEMTLSVFDTPLDLHLKDAQAIRNQLLKTHKWIDFACLADFCWRIGIPVIYLADPPRPKMDGLALEKNGRPIIVLTKQHKHGVLVFDLAHELGHIMCGHVHADQIMLDRKLDIKETNKLEQQATEFALELLTSKKNTYFNTKKTYSPNGLAQAMIAKGRQLHIDPLHICWNYAYNSKQFPFAMKTQSFIVNKLGITQTDPQIAQMTYLRYVDIDALLDDEIVRHILGITTVQTR